MEPVPFKTDIIFLGNDRLRERLVCYTLFYFVPDLHLGLEFN